MNRVLALFALVGLICAQQAGAEGTFELRQGVATTSPIFLEGSLATTNVNYVNYDQHRVTFLRVDIFDPASEVIDLYGQALSGSPDVQVWCPGRLPVPTPDAPYTVPTPDYTADFDASVGGLSSFAEVQAVQSLGTRPRPPRTYLLTGGSPNCGTAGVYTIRYSSAGIDGAGQQFFDIRVRNTASSTLETGRVWADKYAFSMSNGSGRVGSQLYVVAGADRGSDYLGIVWLLDLNDIAPHGFQLFANDRGVGPAQYNYQSIGNSATPPPEMDPLYPIYLNPPAKPVVTPGALGNIEAIDTQCVAGGASEIFFRFDTAGSLPYTIRLDEDQDGFFDLDEVIATGTSVDGTNAVVWDGTLPGGGSIVAGTTYEVELSLTQGEVHFPFYDVEDADPGPVITPFSVPASSTTSLYYWDDTNPSITRSAGGGTTSGPNGTLATHDWANGLNDYRDANMIDTWKFADVQSIQDIYEFPSSCAAAPVIGLAKDAAITADNGDGSVELTLDFRIENLGNIDLQDVQITDDIAAALPAPVVWSVVNVATSSNLTANAGFDGDGDTDLLDAAGSTLPLGDVGLVSVVLDVDFNGEAGPYTNTATATADDGTTPVSDVSHAGTDPDPNGDGDPIEDTPTPLPIAQSDIEVSKSIDVATPYVGDPVNWTVTVTNNGPITETGAEVTESLPAGFSVDSVTPSGGTWSSPVWTLPSLAPGQSETLTITGSFTTAGSFVNSAELTAAVNPDPDSTPGNDQPAEDDQVESSATVAPLADVSVSKSDGSASVVPGTSVSYLIEVANAGPSPVTGVELNDATPAGLSLAGVTAPCAGGFPCTLPTLNAGDSITVTATFEVPAGYSGSDPISNTATITSPVDDPDTGNDTSTDTTPLAPPETDLALTKAVNNPAPSVGNDVTFTIDVVNNGPSNATGVEVNDLLPSGYTYVSDSPSQGSYDDGTGLWSVGTLADGATASLQITATVLDSGSYLNSASVTGTETDPVPGNNDDDASLSPVSVADLAISKTDGGAGVVPGTNVTYTITVNNLGPSAADNVIVSDPTPAGLALVSVSAPCGSLPCNLGTIAASASANFTVTFAVPSDYSGPDPITNTASVVSDADDPAPGNDSATDTTPVAAPLADLAVTKDDGGAVVPTGDSVTYTIEVTNDGPSAADNVIVDDVTPPGLLFNANAGACSTPFPCSLGTLDVDETAVIQATFDVPIDYSGSDPIINTVSVDSDTQELDLSDNEATDNTPVAFDGQNPVIGLAKALSDVTPTDGPTVLVFTLTVENLGNVPLNEVQVEDDLAATFEAPALFVVENVDASSTLVANFGYDGQSDIDLLDSAASSLAVGATATITLELSLDLSGTLQRRFENSALASGQGPIGQITQDVSNNGFDPDPDGDGDPQGTDEDIPTPVELGGIQLRPVPVMGLPGLLLLALSVLVFGGRFSRRRTG